MNTIKTIWLTVVLIVVTLAGAACGVQPTSEEFETVEVQEAVAKSDQTATGEAPTANLLLWQGPALFEKDQSVCHQFIITADNQALIGLGAV